MPVSLDLRQVLFVGHAAIHDYCAAALVSATGFENLQHLLQRGTVHTVALKNLVRLGKPVTVEHQAHDDLLAVGTLVARVSPPSFGVVQALALEAARRQIVKKVGVVAVETSLFTLV